MAGKASKVDGLWVDCDCAVISPGFTCLTRSGQCGTGDGWRVVGHPGKSLSGKCAKALGIKRERTLELDGVKERKSAPDATQTRLVGEGTHKGLLTKSALEGTSKGASAAIAKAKGQAPAKAKAPAVKAPAKAPAKAKRKRPAAKSA